MGIDVSANKDVTFNATHEHRVITAIHLNPKKSKVGKNPRLDIFNIYTRTKQGDDRRDGNPLIYGLKNMHGFTLSYASLLEFKPTFSAIVDKTLNGWSYPYVLSMPFSSRVAEQFARRIARKLGAVLINSAFSKRTASEILADYYSRHVVPKSRHKSDVNRVLAELAKVPPNTLFSMKKVENNIREYFRPLKLNPHFDFAPLVGGTVILSDDLLSTGTTLLNARDALLEVKVACNQGVCLLSDL